MSCEIKMILFTFSSETRSVTSASRVTSQEDIPRSLTARTSIFSRNFQGFKPLSWSLNPGEKEETPYAEVIIQSKQDGAQNEHEKKRDLTNENFRKNKKP